MAFIRYGVLLCVLLAGCANLAPSYQVVGAANNLVEMEVLGTYFPIPHENRTISVEDEPLYAACRVDWYTMRTGSPSPTTLLTLGLGAAAGEAISTTTPIVAVLSLVLGKFHIEWRNDRNRYIEACVKVRRQQREDAECRYEGKMYGPGSEMLQENVRKRCTNGKWIESQTGKPNGPRQ